MKLYIIINVFGYDLCSDESYHHELPSIGYISKERALEAIHKEIALGEFRNGYDEPIIVDELPTMDELESEFGWIISEGAEYNGYKIRELEVIE